MNAAFGPRPVPDMNCHFCMLFDRNYLAKGVVTLRSLKRQCPEAFVFVLCMDDETKAVLEELKLPDISTIRLADIESEALLEVKKDRGGAEYCWTLSPYLPWYVFQQYPQVEFLTYIDSDLYFYSPVDPLFEEIGDSSIAIIEHRFSPRLQDREVNGRFCVEWVSFRRDEEGMACLERWKDQCIEWCYYRLEDGRMGDQKYLDEWPERYRSCHIIEHTGAGVAPWNYSQYRFEENGGEKITVDGAPLIFYHFHQFQILDKDRFSRLSGFYTEECREPEAVYAIYEQAVGQAIKDIKKLRPGFDGGVMRPERVAARRLAQRYMPRPIKEAIRWIVRY